MVRRNDLTKKGLDDSDADDDYEYMTMWIANNNRGDLLMVAAHQAHGAEWWYAHRSALPADLDLWPLNPNRPETWVPCDLGGRLVWVILDQQDAPICFVDIVSDAHQKAARAGRSLDIADIGVPYDLTRHTGGRAWACWVGDDRLVLDQQGMISALQAWHDACEAEIEARRRAEADQAKANAEALGLIYTAQGKIELPEHLSLVLKVKNKDELCPTIRNGEVSEWTPQGWFDRLVWRDGQVMARLASDGYTYHVPVIGTAPRPVPREHHDCSGYGVCRICGIEGALIDAADQVCSQCIEEAGGPLPSPAQEPEPAGAPCSVCGAPTGIDLPAGATGAVCVTCIRRVTDDPRCDRCGGRTAFLVGYPAVLIKGKALCVMCAGVRQ